MCFVVTTVPVGVANRTVICSLESDSDVCHVVRPSLNTIVSNIVDYHNVTYGGGRTVATTGPTVERW